VSAARAGRPVILDRDGTIVVDCGYLDDPQHLTFLPGATEGLRMLHRSGHPLIVISNQSGVGRGMFTLERLHEVNLRFTAMLEEAGAPLSGLYYCPHRPEEGCDCRKPNTALLHEAAAKVGFEPAEAVVIGDKSSDIELGRRVGATTILVSAGAAASDGKPADPDYIARDLVEAARIIDQLSDASSAGVAAKRGA
jgi:D-glycero-D-manno-heptose 1,7-bisphosphate phosphatase